MLSRAVLALAALALALVVAPPVTAAPPTVSVAGSSLAVANRSPVTLRVTLSAPGSLTVEWGDGTRTEAVAVCADDCPPLAVTHRYPARGSYAVRASLVTGDETATATTTAVVRNNPPRWVTTPTLRFIVGRTPKRLRATDLDGDRVRFAVVRGRLPRGLKLRKDGRLVRTGLVKEGTYHPTIRLTDGHGGATAQRFTIRAIL
ncbi:PKD domain-containing protein [Nocardioides sp. SYSU D00038]|uniref:PKD domain-containing protein n=1 Tax=Nocardioides sp. SYSU D00038 TaxID=2812554 RepID=UPI00196792B1|nr:putative Ig domain-containing protein [Nocardioides sp. SYSU D00038]